MSTIHITSKTGVRFCVRFLVQGDAYGLDNCLTWEHADRPGVEFYDTRHPHTPLGQFVSRYFAETILETTGGLDLLTYVADWKVDAEAMDIVRAWLKAEVKAAEPEEEESKLHAHFSTTSTDCDGRIDRDYVLVMDDDERASEFGDIEFHDRVVALVVNTYSLDSEGTLRVTKHDDGTRLEWSEPTEEGFRHTEVSFCSDDCDEAATNYRDHTAESMGY